MTKHNRRRSVYMQSMCHVLKSNNWKRGNLVAGRPPGGNMPSGGSAPSGAKGGKGKPWGRSGKSQVHNTEAEDAQDEDRDSGSEEEEDCVEEEEQGKE